MNLHIGLKIKEVLEQRGITKVNFAKQIYTTKQNVYDIFERESIDTALLLKISKILQYDFFRHYIQSDLQVPEISVKSATQEKRRIMIAIEVDEDTNDRITQLVLSDVKKKITRI